jgi:hypothetical protein
MIFIVGVPVPLEQFTRAPERGDTLLILPSGLRHGETLGSALPGPTVCMVVNLTARHFNFPPAIHDSYFFV